jgi:hypothetical protein
MDKIFYIGDKKFSNLSDEELKLRLAEYSEKVDKDRSLNIIAAKFMGWDECFDDEGNCINQDKFIDIVGESYPNKGYDPINIPEQYMKIVFKLIEYGYMIGFDNFNGIWELEVTPKEENNIPDTMLENFVFEEDYKLGKAICIALSRLVKDNHGYS